MWDCVEAAMGAVVPTAAEREEHLERLAPAEQDTSDPINEPKTEEDR